MARDFSTQERIFLCGDAAHTHSSGAAQGLNTGIHDAVNLGWKLALQIRGVTQDEVLKTYAPERMSAVQQLINYDKDIATLMSYKWPAWYKGDPNNDPYIVLGEIFEQAASFNTGLGISYSANILNQTSPVDLGLAPGSRPPDVELIVPGTNQKVRLQRITRNVAKFWVVVFSANVSSTKSSLLELEKYLASKTELTSNNAIGWVTVASEVGCSPYEAIGMKPFGDTYFDTTHLAHKKYGVKMEKGSVAILRPDGLLGSGGPISGEWINEYFKRILKL
jgi:phenol 2-monooxygenase (NADPH)